MDLILKRRLQAVLASYGADPARWPAAERAGLLPYLEMAPEGLDEARQIDRLLNLAVAPVLAAGLESRLLARLAAGPPANAVSFQRPGAPHQSRLGWAAALPLAASLALGIYLGAMGSLDSLLPAVVTGTVVSADDDANDISGATEATDYSEDQLS